MAEARQPNVLVRLFRGLWRALDTSRRVAVNLLFLFIVILLLAAIAAGVPKLEPKTALVLAPEGAIVEQYSASPVDRAMSGLFGDAEPEVQLRDILRAIDAAAKDPAIERIVVVPDEITSVGWGSLSEIGAALTRFRKSGKQVVAYGDAMDQRGYYLAAHADEVYLHPEGAVLLEGVGRSRTYFKGAFDKLGIEPRLFRVGEFKSAGEPYIRTDQSPEAREADLYWMSDIWQRFLADVARLRKLDAAALAAEIEAYDTRIVAADGDLAGLAKQQGLVDALKTRDEVRALLIERGAADEEGETFRQIGIEDYAQIAQAMDLGVGKPQVAIVVAEGEIVDGEQPPGTIGGDSTAYLLRKAREDEEIKAVVLRVDSPGGGVFPSELIRREVELTRAAGKPVVVSMGDVAASGGYWISMNADRIYANANTITGSIGIFALWFNAPQTMDKLGLNADGAATTWVTRAFDPREPFDERAGTIIQSVIDRGYRQFIGKVAKAREEKVEAIDRVARGRVWSGAQAKERGLVDALGTLDEAIADAAKRAKLDHWHVRYVERELSPFEAFLVNSMRSAARSFAREAGLDAPAALLPAAQVAEIRAAQQWVRDALARKPFEIYAHCLCELR